MVAWVPVTVLEAATPLCPDSFPVLPVAYRAHGRVKQARPAHVFYREELRSTDLTKAPVADLGFEDRQLEPRTAALLFLMLRLEARSPQGQGRLLTSRVAC